MRIVNFAAAILMLALLGACAGEASNSGGSGLFDDSSFAAPRHLPPVWADPQFTKG